MPQLQMAVSVSEDPIPAPSSAAASTCQVGTSPSGKGRDTDQGSVPPIEGILTRETVHHRQREGGIPGHTLWKTRFRWPGLVSQLKGSPSGPPAAMESGSQWPGKLQGKLCLHQAIYRPKFDRAEAKAMTTPESESRKYGRAETEAVTSGRIGRRSGPHKHRDRCATNYETSGGVRPKCGQRSVRLKSEPIVSYFVNRGRRAQGKAAPAPLPPGSGAGLTRSGHSQRLTQQQPKPSPSLSSSLPGKVRELETELPARAWKLGNHCLPLGRLQALEARHPHTRPSHWELWWPHSGQSFCGSTLYQPVLTKDHSAAAIHVLRPFWGSHLCLHYDHSAAFVCFLGLAETLSAARIDSSYKARSTTVIRCWYRLEAALRHLPLHHQVVECSAVVSTSSVINRPRVASVLKELGRPGGGIV